MQDKEPWEYERLSALLDSALDEHEWDAALALGDDPQGQERLAMYEYIGDVLRSPDLAHYTPQRSQALLQSLRVQLRAESVRPASQASSAAPVPLESVASAAQTVRLPSEQRDPAANDSVFRWKMVAGVATCAAVLGVVWGSGMLGAGQAVQWAASSAVIAPESGGLVAVPAVVASTAPATAARASGSGLVVASSAELPSASLVGRSVEWPLERGAANEPATMLRDPRLDELMAAHRQYGGAAALQLPADFLRNANFEGRRP